MTGDALRAYAIQGLGAHIVTRIEGDYCNAIGLPLSRHAEMLKKFGVHIFKSTLHLFYYNKSCEMPQM